MLVKRRTHDGHTTHDIAVVRSPDRVLSDQATGNTHTPPASGDDVRICIEQTTDMESTTALLKRSFPQGYPHDAGYLQWLYRSGHHAATVVAVMQGDDKIGQMVLLPYEMVVDGETRLFGLVVDFFIAPEHRSGPLTIKLCRKVVEFGTAAGFDGLYGVPNTISMGITPRLLRTRTIRKLGIRVGLAAPVRRRGVSLSALVDTLRDADIVPLLDHFVSHSAGGRKWTGASLVRRLRSPITRFALHGNDDAVAISCRHTIKGLDFTTLCGFLPADGKTIPPASMRALVAAACHTHRNPMFCYIGFNETLVQPPGIAVPERWHPSPVTLTTRAFTPGGEGFNPQRFELIDYDMM